MGDGFMLFINIFFIFANAWSEFNSQILIIFLQIACIIFIFYQKQQKIMVSIEAIDTKLNIMKNKIDLLVRQ